MTCGADGKDARGNDCSDKMDGDHDHMDHWKHCLETMSETECTEMKMNGDGMFADMDGKMDHWKHCLETMSESECTKMKLNGEGMFAADSDYDTEWLDYIYDLW